MRPKIYLAGGFRGGWHQQIIKALGNDFICFNPQTHQLDDADKYTAWDLYHIEKCDILLGYMTQNNPSGYGLALEIGFAKAKGKLIILIDERSKIDEEFERYFLICHESSNIVLSDLDEAISYIKSFAF